MFQCAFLNILSLSMVLFGSKGCVKASLDGVRTETGTSGFSVTGVSPSSGSISGGTLVTITGTGFKDGATVTIGGVSCTSLTVVSPTSITCRAGAASAGNANVVVTNPDSQAATLINGYTYSTTSTSNPAPTVISISPAIGSVSGGTSVTLTGTGFLTGATVTLGTVACTGVSVTSTASLTCTTASRAAGDVDVTVTNTDSQSGTLTAGFFYQAAIVSSWAFVDGNGANGINKDSSRNAFVPQLTPFNSKLYAIWFENDAGGIPQIRTSVYNGNDSSPAWSFIDGNGATGINKNPAQTNGNVPQLTVFNSKLYATWMEGGIIQIRMAVYNGNDSSPTWSFVDGNAATGINKNTARDGWVPQLTVFNSKFYGAWRENDGGGTGQIRMVVYNGNDASPTWTFIDGNGANGLNKSTAQHATNPQLTVFNSKLYTTWQETNGTNVQVRTAVYNGNDSSPTWSFIDGNGANGINKNTSMDAGAPQLTVFDSKLYATWFENNAVPKYQVRVVVYNGNDSSPSWSFVDGNGAALGINYNTSDTTQGPQLTVSNRRLYAIWAEFKGGATHQTRVKVYNGNDSSPSWSFVDGNGVNGINKDTSQSALYNQITDFNYKLYGTWMEASGAGGQIRMIVGQ